jgi:hypothetical protein
MRYRIGVCSAGGEAVANHQHRLAVLSWAGADEPTFVPNSAPRALLTSAFRFKLGVTQLPKWAIQIAGKDFSGFVMRYHS